MVNMNLALTFLFVSNTLIHVQHELVDGLSSDILTSVVDGHDGCVVSLGSSSRGNRKIVDIALDST